MFKDNAELHEIGEAFTTISYSLWPKGTWAANNPQPRQAVKDAENRLYELTGLEVSDLKENPQEFVHVADEIVREELGIGDGYVLHNHIPTLGPKINDNNIFEFWVENLEYIGKDTQDLSNHYKLCCAHIMDVHSEKTDRISYKPLVVSPFSALQGKKNIAKYVETNPTDGSLAGLFANWMVNDRRLAIMTDLEQVASVIGEVAGARKIDTIRKGYDFDDKCRENEGIWNFSKFKAHSDSVLFSFGSVPEVDAALPVISKSWDVADSNPSLIKDLIGMRKEMYFADDLLVHNDKTCVWANHALHGIKEAYEKNLGLVSDFLGEDGRGVVASYRDSSVVKPYSSVESRIRNEIERRNSEYVQKVSQFQEKVTGSGEVDRKKLIQHIEKPQKTIEIFGIL